MWMVNTLCVMLFHVKLVLLLGTADGCDIPPRSGNQRATPALEFTFSPNEFLDVRLEDNIYELRDCNLFLYLKSTEKQLISLILALLPKRYLQIQCMDKKTMSMTLGTVNVVYPFGLRSDQPLPDVIPEEWLRGDRIIAEISYHVFPTRKTSMKCFVKEFGAYSLTITTTPIGCPTTHWGTKCQNSCSCPTGVRCHTFTGSCLVVNSTTTPPTGNDKRRRSYRSLYSFPEETSSSGPQTISADVPNIVETTTQNSFARNVSQTTGVQTKLSSREYQVDANLIDKCHIASRDPSRNQSATPAVEFTYSLSKSLEAHVEDHTYKVTDCNLFLYLKSTEHRLIGLAPLLLKKSVFRISCVDMKDLSVTLGTGNVIYPPGLGANQSMPDVIPEEWLRGNRIILEISYHVFPTRNTSMKCSVEEFGAYSLNITTTPIGCPKGRWGALCDRQCQCNSRRNCHTFSGSCESYTTAAETTTKELESKTGSGSTATAVTVFIYISAFLRYLFL